MKTSINKLTSLILATVVTGLFASANITTAAACEGKSSQAVNETNHAQFSSKGEESTVAGFGEQYR